MANHDHINDKFLINLGWAAGFLEGEGSFSGGAKMRHAPSVSAAQVEKEPIDRLISIFGGKCKQRITRGFSTKPIWIWSLDAYRSVQVMMTLYTLMSPRRKEQIEIVLRHWATSRRVRRRGATECLRGHPQTAENVFVVRGYSKCRQCRTLNKRARRARLKANGSNYNDAGSEASSFRTG